MVSGVVDEENNPLYLMPFRVSNKSTEMLSEFNISPFFEAIPDYFLIRPDEANKKITPGSVS